MTWKLTYRHKLPKFYELGDPKFSIDEYIEFFYKDRYIGYIVFYCLNSHTMSLTRIYITPNYRGKGFQMPMIQIAGHLYDSIQIQEILLNEDLEKYGEVEAHYIKMEFMRDKTHEDRYFNIIDKKSRLFKMIRFTR